MGRTHNGMKTMAMLLGLLMAGCAGQVDAPREADAGAEPVDAAQVWIDSPTWGPYNEGDAGLFRASWLEAGDH